MPHSICIQCSKHTDPAFGYLNLQGTGKSSLPNSKLMITKIPGRVKGKLKLQKIESVHCAMRVVLEMLIDCLS